jgi:hypothetical protein
MEQPFEFKRDTRRINKKWLAGDSRWSDPTTNHGKFVSEGFSQQLADSMIKVGADPDSARSTARYIGHQVAQYANGVGSPDGPIGKTRDDIRSLADALRRVTKAFDQMDGTAAEYRVRVLSGFFYELPSMPSGEFARRLAGSADPISALSADYDATRAKVADWADFLDLCAALDVPTATRHLNAEGLFIEAIEAWNEVSGDTFVREDGRYVLFDIIERAVCSMIGSDHELAARLTEGRFIKILKERGYSAS